MVSAVNIRLTTGEQNLIAFLNDNVFSDLVFLIVTTTSTTLYTPVVISSILLLCFATQLLISLPLVLAVNNVDKTQLIIPSYFDFLEDFDDAPLCQNNTIRKPEIHVETSKWSPNSPCTKLVLIRPSRVVPRNLIGIVNETSVGMIEGPGLRVSTATVEPNPLCS